MGSSTESKVFLETTRTTSQTMRMEHKTSFNDLPPVTHSQRTQTPSILQVDEGTMFDKKFETKEQSTINEFTQTQAPQATEVPKLDSVPFPFIDTVDATERTVTPTFNLTARDFFRSNLSDLPPLQDDKYTRYDEVVKKSNKTYVVKQNEIKEQFQSKLVEDLSYLNLRPEPPPEMGFMPKAQQNQPERIVEKVKKLEEIHKTSETPLSGTLHPPTQIFQKAASPTFSQDYQKVETSLYENSSISRQRTVSPFPSINKENLLPIDSQTNFRSASPKPSLEAVNMEKLWTSKPKTPEPFVQESFSQEHKSSFVAYSSNQTQIVQPQTEIQPEMPKTIKDTKSFFEQKFKEESASHEFKSPGLVKQFVKPMTPVLPTLDMEPGEPPEICYAPKPVERRQSYVEKVEKVLEQTLDKEPDRVPRGGVRIIPARQTPQRGVAAPSPQRIEVAPSPQQMFSLPKQDVIKPEPIAAPRAAQPFEPFKSSFIEEKVQSQFSEITNTSYPGYRHVEPPKLGKQVQEIVAEPPAQLYESTESYQKTQQFNESKQTFISSEISQPTIAPQQFVPPQPQPKAEIVMPPQNQPQTFVPKYSIQPFRPKPKYGEVVSSEPQRTLNLYKNFVKSEENMHSSESYFQKVESRTQSQTEKEIISPFQQVLKQIYPDVML